MAAYLIIYDSSRPASRGMALQCLVKYPTATLADWTGKNATAITAAIGALGATSYDKILNCIGNKLVEAVGATAVITVSNKGANTDMGMLTIDDGVNDPYPIGTVIGDAGGDTTSVAQALKGSINAGTANHGFVASGAAAIITVTAPTTLGAAANTYVMAWTKLGAGALAAAVGTQFGAGVAGVTAVGVLGDMTEAQFITLEAKIVATAENTDTAQAGAAGTITLIGTASAVNDYYKGMTIMTTGGAGSGQVRTITGYVGSTKVATISGDANWGSNPGANTTYIVSNDLLDYGHTFTNLKTPYLLMWEHLMPSYDVPFMIKLISGIYTEIYHKHSVTADSCASLTLSDAAQFAANAYDAGSNDSGDYYVAIQTSTIAGEAGQIKKIASNTAGVLTLAEEWDVIPSGTVTYQIGHGKDVMLWDYYVAYGFAARSFFTGATIPSALLNDFKKLVDKYDGISNNRSSIYQDLDFLEEIAMEGKVIFNAYCKGIVS